ncbi:MAG: peptidase, partial [Leptolyngbya sp. ERB_1_2]
MQYRELLLAGVLSLGTLSFMQSARAAELGCPAPALSRLSRHTVKSGETLESIASRYNLIPATVMGLNPNVRSGKATVGQQLLIPPYNGIRVEVPAGQSL